jgi:hypothetical protein
MEFRVMAQLDAKENSGAVLSAGELVPKSPSCHHLGPRAQWPTVLRAHCRDFLPPLAQELIDLVTDRCRAGAKERFYLRAQLHYEGLPWKGELWLSDTLRLGPPSKQDETA